MGKKKRKLTRKQILKIGYKLISEAPRNAQGVLMSSSEDYFIYSKAHPKGGSTTLVHFPNDSRIEIGRDSYRVAMIADKKLLRAITLGLESVIPLGLPHYHN